MGWSGVMVMLWGVSGENGAGLGVVPKQGHLPRQGVTSEIRSQDGTTPPAPSRLRFQDEVPEWDNL